MRFFKSTRILRPSRTCAESVIVMERSGGTIIVGAEGADSIFPAGDRVALSSFHQRRYHMTCKHGPLFQVLVYHVIYAHPIPFTFSFAFCSLQSYALLSRNWLYRWHYPAWFPFLSSTLSSILINTVLAGEEGYL